jgi:ribosomal protein S18 acetylase RimI-like enzyme/DNA-binding MarR family transcriptional regulator
MKRDEIFFELGLGTRMRRLTELLSSDIERLYNEQGIDIRMGHFYAIYAVAECGPMTINEIRACAGFSQSAVSQTVKKLLALGVFETRATEDARQRLIALSTSGEALVEKVRPLWRALEKTVIDAGASDLLLALSKMEQALEKESLYSRMHAVLEAAPASMEFDIVPYETQYAKAFYDLNIRWIKAYFKVEPIDELALSDPETHILAKGGEIYLAVNEGKAVGAVAMKLEEPGVFELTKLAVDPDVQKSGMGKALSEKVIERFKARGGKTLFLETNDKLTPAIKLYEKLGFEQKPYAEPSPYERANYYMEWEGGDA